MLYRERAIGLRDCEWKGEEDGSSTTTNDRGLYDATGLKRGIINELREVKGLDILQQWGRTGRKDMENMDEVTNLFCLLIKNKFDRSIVA
ncbi:hypothetical protein DL98DRAFT_24123 [Cadophora sp. DSE1049]|nr:hypothetical protein DL98DRAFT_24123 [Cadophora sp. DSE1049]